MRTKTNKKHLSTLSKYQERTAELKQGVSMNMIGGESLSSNPWSPSDVDTLESLTLDEYKEAVDACRFFYKHDPLAASAVNKIIEIALNEIKFNSNGLSQNELKIFENVKQKLLDFSRNMGLEYMLTGMVIPEMSYAPFTKDQLNSMGMPIKMKEVVTLPSSMWVRDSKQVEIKSALVGDKPTYWIEIPAKTIYFIMHEGRYQDGTVDKELYNQLLRDYPQFVTEVRGGAKKMKLDNPFIFRGKYLADSPYPIPYLYASLESMKHKRNLRRMDYSLASRVITAIMLIKVGSDEFPITEDDDYVFDDLRRQLAWRWNGSKPDMERVYQLFANHTIEIEWVIPDVAALLDDAKYGNVNKDIIQGLGLPSILIAGETEKSGSGGSNDYSMISPEASMKAMRNQLLVVLQAICNEIANRNHLPKAPIIKFAEINLNEFTSFRQGLADLYATGNLSRTSYAEFMGFNWIDEMVNRESENKVLKEKNLEEFSPKPFSNAPETPGANKGGNQKKDLTEKKPKIV